MAKHTLFAMKIKGERMEKRGTHKKSRTAITGKLTPIEVDEQQKNKETRVGVDLIDRSASNNRASESKSLLKNVAGYDVPYFGENHLMAHAISIVLLNVPETVSNFAITRCIFTSQNRKTQDGSCTKLPLQARVIVPSEIWLIELSEDIPYKSSLRYRKYYLRYLRYLAAHELAHAYLNHDGTDPDDKEGELVNELAADRLAQQWGFRQPF